MCESLAGIGTGRWRRAASHDDRPSLWRVRWVPIPSHLATRRKDAFLEVVDRNVAFSLAPGPGRAGFGLGGPGRRLPHQSFPRRGGPWRGARQQATKMAGLGHPQAGCRRSLGRTTSACCGRRARCAGARRSARPNRSAYEESCRADEAIWLAGSVPHDRWGGGGGGGEKKKKKKKKYKCASNPRHLRRWETSTRSIRWPESASSLPTPWMTLPDAYGSRSVRISSLQIIRQGREASACFPRRRDRDQGVMVRFGDEGWTKANDVYTPSPCDLGRRLPLPRRSSAYRSAACSRQRCGPHGLSQAVPLRGTRRSDETIRRRRHLRIASFADRWLLEHNCVDVACDVDARPRPQDGGNRRGRPWLAASTTLSADGSVATVEAGPRVSGGSPIRASMPPRPLALIT